MAAKKRNDTIRIWDIAVSAAALGLTLCVSLGIGIACGFWLDEQLGTKPWGLIGGGLLGAVSGFWTLYKKAVRYMKDETPGHTS